MMNSRSKPMFSVVRRLLPCGILLVSMGGKAQMEELDSEELRLPNPVGLTEEEARSWAVEQARMVALAKAFGTRVSSETVRLTSQSGEAFQDQFSRLSTTQVKGEWIRTTEVEGPCPEVEDCSIWWKVRVWGEGRPVNMSSINLEMGLVRDQHGQGDVDGLSHGERIRLSFLSPVDGHVMFFYQEDDRVFGLARNRENFASKVEGQQSYLLFNSMEEWSIPSSKRQGAKGMGQYDYGFTVDNPNDLESTAVLIAAFSVESAFAPPIMKQKQDDGIGYMTLDDFGQWIKSMTGKSDAFQVSRKTIPISPSKKF